MCCCFWLFDKNEIVISATSGEVSIISFASVSFSCRNSKCKFKFNIFCDYKDNKVIA